MGSTNLQTIVEHYREVPWEELQDAVDAFNEPSARREAEDA